MFEALDAVPFSTNVHWDVWLFSESPSYADLGLVKLLFWWTLRKWQYNPICGLGSGLYVLLCERTQRVRQKLAGGNLITAATDKSSPLMHTKYSFISFYISTKYERIGTEIHTEDNHSFFPPSLYHIQFCFAYVFQVVKCFVWGRLSLSRTV